MTREIVGVFAGGGIRGIALAGAAAAAEDLGYQFRQGVGTSAGAIVASLVAARATPDDLKSAVISVDWPNVIGPASTLQKNIAMVRHLGFHSGATLGHEIRRVLADLGVSTFADLEPGSLRVVATDLTHGRGVVLPDDLESLGYEPEEFEVAYAVLMSSSVPFIFEPVQLKDRVTGEMLLLADGAMAARFPAQLVKHGPNAIGFRLQLPKDAHQHQEIRGPVSLATAVISAGISAREDLPPICGPLNTVIEISVDHNSLDFDVSPALAEEMFDLGYQETIAQLPAASVALRPQDGIEGVGSN